MYKAKHYCITQKNVLGHELIGLKARIVKSVDKSRIGLKGRIVDETQNTLKLETAKGEKIIPKKEVWLELDLKGEKTIIEGSLIAVKPEARTKLFWRKRHG